MNEHEKQLLSPYLKRSSEKVDEQFCDQAKKALAETGQTALEFLDLNPGLSLVELARRLNRGASAIGLLMAVYEEAVGKGLLREASKNILLRKILEKYPEGWCTADNVGPLVKIGLWAWEIGRYTDEPRFKTYATQIIRELIDHPPPERWKPQSERDDPMIDSLFDRFWPA
jgi:hypothetical protein